MTGKRVVTLISLLSAVPAARAAAQASGTVMASVTVVDTRLAESASRIAGKVASEWTGRHSSGFRHDAGAVSVVAPAIAAPAPAENNRPRLVTVIFW